MLNMWVVVFDSSTGRNCVSKMDTDTVMVTVIVIVIVIVTVTVRCTVTVTVSTQAHRPHTYCELMYVCMYDDDEVLVCIKVWNMLRFSPNLE